MKIIYSRYGEKRTITDVGGGCYIVEGRSKYYRVAADEKKVNLFDFEGGPCLYVGFKLFDDCSNSPIIESLIPEKTKDGWAKVTVSVKYENPENDDDWK